MKTSKNRYIKVILVNIICISLIYAILVQVFNSKQSLIEKTSISAKISPVAISETDLAEEITDKNAEVDFPIYSEGAILMEASTGKVLCGKNEKEKLYPASTTKILTAIIAIEKCKLTDKITASREAVMSIPSGYSNAAIQPGEILTMQELLDLFLIHSANEVGYIFAEHISGNVENFAILMNQKAKEIGCENTHFTNPSGIHDEEHYSTPYDMAIITRYCMKNEIFRTSVAKTSCTIEATDKFEKRYYKNTNELINSKSKYYYENAIGVKTGFTSQAKNCLIAASKKDSMELITVALGAEATEDGRSGRYVDSINMFEYGFSNYKIQKIATENTTIQDIVVNKATKETRNVSLVLKNDIMAFTPNDIDVKNLKYSIDLKENIVAPIAQGDILGKITYNIDGVIYSEDLIANHNVEELNIPTVIIQIIIAIIIVFIIAKIFSIKKKSKNKKRKKFKNNQNNFDSIYKF